MSTATLAHDLRDVPAADLAELASLCPELAGDVAAERKRRLAAKRIAAP
jgi:hypothetical protein